MKKGLASVEQHIRREFERVRIIEHIVTKEAEGQTPQVERIAFTLERRAQSPSDFDSSRRTRRSLGCLSATNVKPERPRCALQRGAQESRLWP
jgi:hypothetical protein